MASDIDDREAGWLRIDGVFLRGPAGHMGAYAGEIARITCVEPAPPHVPSPDEPRRWPSSSWVFVMVYGLLLLLAYVAIWLVRAATRMTKAQGSQPSPQIDGGSDWRQSDRS